MEDSATTLLRQHVERWRQGSAELQRVWEQELQAVDTCEAVRQLFGENTLIQDVPRLTTSGLVEQQAWFTKLRKRTSK